VECLVEMEGITKEFGGVKALDQVSFQLYSGEVHVLLGENGAGKSTLMKILSGVYEPTSGIIRVSGREFTRLTPRQSAEQRISIIYQELSLIDELSIAENLFIGKLPTRKRWGFPMVDFAAMQKKAAELLDKVGLNRSPKELVKQLSISEKQQVEIAKALAADARIIIMDEPTSSLTPEETRKLFAIIRQLKSEGAGIIYISHKLKELKEIGDRVTVLKDGKYVGTRHISEVTTDDLVFMMVGRELKEKYTQSQQASRKNQEVILKVENLTRKDRKVRNVSFELYKGEILGFTGLIGSGRTELMNAIYGSDPIETGRIWLFGQEVRIRNPYHAVKLGIGLLTENRREAGIFQNFEIWKNVSVAKLLKEAGLNGTWGLVNKKMEQAVTREQKSLLNIKFHSHDQNITELSGGNQQKVLVGKWLAADSRLLIFDEPTKGIDVGAKSEIYRILRRLADEGKGVLVVSSELPELLAICDRIIVFREGEITAVLTSEDATEEKIMLAATS